MRIGSAVMVCVLCHEEITPEELRGRTNLPTHRECGLREVLGGIGHLIDHDHWCVERHDPDGGLTYRESAQMVSMWLDLKGVDEVLGDE